MRLLFVDDERGFTDLVLAELPHEWNKYAAYSLAEARAVLRNNVIDVVVLDLRLPDGDGLDLLREIRNKPEGPEVFVLTGHGSVPEAVEAMRLGVFDFVTKPVPIDDLETIIKSAGMRRGIDLGKSDDASENLEGLLPPRLRALGRQVLDIARTDIPILIYGEAGVGKRRFAEFIHAASSRANESLETAACDKGAKESVETELFGQPGSGLATGALLARAQRGTLVLHEIGELSLSAQDRLFHLLSTPADEARGERLPRAIGTTSRVLQNQIESGQFREDLFFRLSGFTITIPPLRERPEDILHFAQEYFGRKIASPAAQALVNHDWPGNMNELQFVLRAAREVAGDAPLIRKAHLEAGFVASGDYYRASLSGPLALRDVEHNHIHRVLKLTKGNQTQAAKLLGIDPKTLYRKLREEESDG